jgi:hypothetical protein
MLQHERDAISTYLESSMFRVSSLFVAVAVCLVAGCSSPGENFVSQMVDANNEVADAIEAGDMEKVKASFEKLSKSIRELGFIKVTVDEQKKTSEKYKEKLKAASARAQSAFRVAEKGGKLTDADKKYIKQEFERSNFSLN